MVTSRQATAVFEAMACRPCERCGLKKASTRKRLFGFNGPKDSYTTNEYCDECSKGDYFKSQMEM